MGNARTGDWNALQLQASAKNRRFLVIQNQLYDPFVQRIGQIIEDGVLGRPCLLVENN